MLCLLCCLPEHPYEYMHWAIEIPDELFSYLLVTWEGDFLLNFIKFFYEQFKLKVMWEIFRMNEAKAQIVPWASMALPMGCLFVINDYHLAKRLYGSFGVWCMAL